MNFLSRFKNRLEQYEARLEQGHHLSSVNVEDMDEHKCLNCHTTFRGEFCPRCGQGAHTSRLTLREGFRQVTAGILKFDKGMSHTIVDLFCRPGYMAYDYIHGYRKEYYPPITILALLVAIVLFLGAFLPPANSSLITVVVSVYDAMFVQSSWFHKVLEVFNKALLNPSLRTIIVAFLSVPFIWLAFHKTKVGRLTNWAETFYLSVLISCNKLLWIILSFPFEFLSFKIFGGSLSGWLFSGRSSFESLDNSSGSAVRMKSDGDIVDFIAFFLMILIVHEYYKISWRSATLRVIFFYVLMALLIILPIILELIWGIFFPDINTTFNFTHR